MVGLSSLRASKPASKKNWKREREREKGSRTKGKKENPARTRARPHRLVPPSRAEKNYARTRREEEEEKEEKYHPPRPPP